MRVILAEDSVLFRHGLANLLTEAGIDVVGQAGTVPELLDLCATLATDVVVVDVRMPPTHQTEGLDAAVALRADNPDQAVLVLSQYVEPHYAQRLLGAAPTGLGYLLKDSVADVDELVEALHRLTHGRTVIDPAVIAAMLTARSARDPLAGLTNREREVLALMAEGRSNAAIANRLWTTNKTVESHVRNIMARLALPPIADDHRRVLAVLTYLRGNHHSR